MTTPPSPRSPTAPTGSWPAASSADRERAVRCATALAADVAPTRHQQVQDDPAPVRRVRDNRPHPTGAHPLAAATTRVVMTAAFPPKGFLLPDYLPQNGVAPINLKRAFSGAWMAASNALGNRVAFLRDQGPH